MVQIFLIVIFSTFVVCINFTLPNIGLFKKFVPSLIPCYIPLTFSERMFLYLVSYFISTMYNV